LPSQKESKIYKPAAVMFSRQKLFSGNEQFFELLEAGAEECRVSVRALKYTIAYTSHPLQREAS